MRYILLLAVVLFHLLPSQVSAAPAEDTAHRDGLPAPRPAGMTTSSTDVAPSRYEPSAFMAGRIAVRLVFVESTGAIEPSQEDWTPTEIADITPRVAGALDWWKERIPNARISFDLTTTVAQIPYEPITHRLETENTWAGSAFAALGFAGSSHYEQAYAAAEALRAERDADWATTILMVNSGNDSDGRFADGMFAYAYVGGPFLVLTSDIGTMGRDRMASYTAHELGHIFGALDQYAAANTPCTQRSGYLAVPTTNSEAGNCGSRFICIMLDPMTAYREERVDVSAQGQVGYYDSDGDTIPDPLDTIPAVQASIEQQGNGRPTIAGTATDIPFPSPQQRAVTINTIARIEYRVNGGTWRTLPPADGRADSATETFRATLPLYDDARTVDVRAVNSVGNVSPARSFQVQVSGMGSAPAFSVSAPAALNILAVPLTIDAPAGSRIQLSTDRTFAGATWQQASSFIIWNAPAEGEYALYARMNINGIETWPIPILVMVDLTAPTARPVYIVDGERSGLQLNADADLSGIVAVQSRGTADLSGWNTPDQTGSQPVDAIRIQDAAGNVSGWLPVSIEYRTRLPLILSTTP